MHLEAGTAGLEQILQDDPASTPFRRMPIREPAISLGRLGTDDRDVHCNGSIFY
jgi:hypothetical protein